mmetsp:Transcript_11277/g.24303  ORF Transcript_11277/g.24303 Transcript_11277/m.24303 type:complete len:261 (+) Transcript_11277:203-985(+)|eukprot:CAMPEP_0202901722 /NCGR_PEP_ID=MMETSP1392-20130828/14420_1 /ASSEMBLY_ACC=CAM_ASM_000868 /TAXON_ID=225041 /ORGANISM="Chlamydomonas chlamydogama, Strain SAG 11-48b" /LENGTH=260 /DNA_ID=CAMNT_0049588331 /DNA_START=175 /DNA_END=957 /DNA_ORIENTATION=+
MEDSRPQACLPLRALNHVSRVCTDVSVTARFYKNVLGFALVKRPSEFQFDGAWLYAYNIGLHLIKGTPVSRPCKIEPKSDHLSFQSDNLSDVEDRLKACDIEYVKQSVCEDGIRISQLFFHDPDNNMIEVCNCDLLPVVPLEDVPLVCPTCLTHVMTSPPCAPASYHSSDLASCSSQDMSLDADEDLVQATRAQQSNSSTSLSETSSHETADTQLAQPQEHLLPPAAMMFTPLPTPSNYPHACAVALAPFSDAIPKVPPV